MTIAFLQPLLIAVLLVAAGCSVNQAPAKADFRATDTAARVPAIVSAADTEDEATLVELVHALSDDDPAVRLFAIQSLQERTGQTFGYRYYDSQDKRQAATDRWHQWLADHLGPALAMPPTDTPAITQPE